MHNAIRPQAIAPDLLRRRLAMALPLLACGLAIAPVHARSDVYSASQALMGTRVDLTLQGPDNAMLAHAARAAWAEMARLADMMSRYRPTSTLNAVNLMAGLQAVPVPPELLRVLLMAQAVAKASSGAFDATVGTYCDWNFSPDHPVVPDAGQIATQRALVDPAGLVIDPQAGTAYLTKRGMRLDLGGIAKLPILQAGLRVLQAHGVANAMLNGGGDVLVMGTLNGRPWRIGLRDPIQPARLLGSVEMSKGFVAASGDYERFLMHQGQRLHHILNPATGYPTQGLHGVTLISERLEDLNGLGPAMMVAGAAFGRARLAERGGLDALMVERDGTVQLSPGMSRRLIVA